MLVLVTYDVATTTVAGRKRLSKVAKECENCGIRVQNSVFECIVDKAQLKLLKLKLCEIIDHKEDSIRFYELGNNYKNRVEHFGAKKTINVEDPLIF